MEHWSDYSGDMERLTPQQIEAILAGRDEGDPEAARIAGLMRRLRDELAREPEPEVARRHLEAMLAAATGAVTETSTRSKTMKVLTGRRLAGLALAATLALGAGISGALVLPDQADDTAKDVTGDLPIPGPTASPPGEANDHGEEVSSVAQDETLEGCEKGQAVAGVASSKAEDRQDDADTPDPCEQGDDGDNGGTTPETTPAGSGSGSGGPGGGSGSGGGSGAGGGGAGGGGGGTTGGGGGGGGSGTGGGGSGSGSGGPGGGSGSGGSTGGTGGGGGGGTPDDVPTPDDLPTP